VLTIEAPTTLAVPAKANLAVAAMRKGLPRVLWAASRVEPLAHAAPSWATAANGLADAGGQLVSDLGEAAICVGAQIAMAVQTVAHIQASISVSVEISVQAQGTVSGGT